MYNILKQKLIIFLIILMQATVHSQADFTHKQILPGTSASANNISDILIDNGRIWVASYDGLQSYDGYTFISYDSPEYKNIPSQLLGIIKDKNGMLWCSDFELPRSRFSPTSIKQEKNISIFNPYSQKVIPFEQYIDTTLLVNYRNEILDIYQDSNQDIWISTKSGTFLKYSESLNKTPFMNVNRRDRVFPIDSIFYLLKKDSIISFNLEHQIVERRYVEGLHTNLEKKTEDTLFLTTVEKYSYPNELTFRTITDREVSEPIITEKSCLDLDHNSKNIVSIHSNEIFVSNIRTGSSQKLNKQFDGAYRSPKLISPDEIYFASSTGIHHFSTNIFPFNIIKNGPNQSNRQITQLNDSLLLYLSYTGVKTQNLFTEELIDYSPDFYFGLIPLPENAFLLGKQGNEFQYLEVDKKGIKTELRLNDTHKEYLQHKVLFNDSFRDITWIGSDLSLRKINNIDLKNRLVRTEATQYNLYDVKCFYQKADTLSIGTSYGLFEIYEDNTIQQIKGINTTIYDIERTSNGNYFLATQDRGLLILNSEGEFIEVNEAEGMSNQTVYSIEIDDEGYIWAGTQSGLSMVNPNNFEIYSFYSKHGLSNDEFNYTSTFKDKSGKLYFGSVDGIVSFYPNEIREKRDSEQSQIQLLEVKSWDPDVQEFRLSSYNVGETLKLEANSRSVRVKLSLDKISQLQKNLFQYKIPGLIDDWKIIPENTIELTNLAAGSYDLIIRTKSSVTSELLIPLRVKQFFYSTWWFLTLVFILPLIAILYFFQRKNSFRKKREKELEEEVRARTLEIVNKTNELELSTKSKDQIISILAHDLRSPLLSLHDVSQKISYLIEQNRTENLKALGKDINKKSHNLQRLVDNMLHWAVIQSGSKNSVLNTFNINGPILQAIDLYSDIADNKNIRLEFYNKENIQLYSDLNIFQTVIRNLLDNAIKYSPVDSIIKIRSIRSNKIAIISVHDQGRGVDADKIQTLNNTNLNDPEMMSKSDGTGLGLSICKHLLQEQNQDLWYNANEPTGSIFRFSQNLFIEEEEEEKEEEE